MKNETVLTLASGAVVSGLLQVAPAAEATRAERRWSLQQRADGREVAVNRGLARDEQLKQALRAAVRTAATWRPMRRRTQGKLAGATDRGRRTGQRPIALKQPTVTGAMRLQRKRTVPPPPAEEACERQSAHERTATMYRRRACGRRRKQMKRHRRGAAARCGQAGDGEDARQRWR